MHPYPDQTLPPRTEAVEGHRDDERTGLVRLVRNGHVPTASCPHCHGRLEFSTVGERWIARRPRDIAERLVLQLGDLEREELHVLLLDARKGVIAEERVYQGNVSSALVRVGELFTDAVRRNAASLVLAHNHPSGDPSPSPDDLHLTAEAVAAGRLLDVPVLDHIVVGGETYVSLRERGVTFDGRGGRTRLHGSGASERQASTEDGVRLSQPGGVR